MAVILDASVVVRYLSGRPPGQAEIARTVIDGDQPVLIGLVALSETAYVLHRIYGLSRDVVVDGMIELLSHRNVDVLGVETALVKDALSLCRGSGRVSFGDALIYAEARQNGLPITTFDLRFPRDDASIQFLGDQVDPVSGETT